MSKFSLFYMFCFVVSQMCLNGKCVSELENSVDYGDELLQRTGTAIISTTFRESPSPPLRFPPTSRPSSSLLALFSLFCLPLIE